MSKNMSTMVHAHAAVAAAKARVVSRETRSLREMHNHHYTSINNKNNININTNSKLHAAASAHCHGNSSRAVGGRVACKAPTPVQRKQPRSLKKTRAKARLAKLAKTKGQVSGRVSVIE